MNWTEPDKKPPQATPTDSPSCWQDPGVGFEIKEQTPAVLSQTSREKIHSAASQRTESKSLASYLQN